MRQKDGIDLFFETLDFPNDVFIFTETQLKNKSDSLAREDQGVVVSPFTLDIVCRFACSETSLLLMTVFNAELRVQSYSLFLLFTDLALETNNYFFRFLDESLRFLYLLTVVYILLCMTLTSI